MRFHEDLGPIMAGEQCEQDLQKCETRFFALDHEIAFNGGINKVIFSCFLQV
jgi:hypothetical protein